MGNTGPAVRLGYRPFAFLEASRHYNNAETGSNEMLRLLHCPERNCCKSANDADCGRVGESIVCGAIRLIRAPYSGAAARGSPRIGRPHGSVVGRIVRQRIVAVRQAELSATTSGRG